MSEELIPCPVCLGTEFDAAQMDRTDAEQCQNCLCVWRKADLIRLRHNARVAEAAEWYVEVEEFDHDMPNDDGFRELLTIINNAREAVHMAVRAARDCRGKEGK